jgi:hypothetical protein
MTTPTTAGLALLGDGKAITLDDGTIIALRYSFRSLALLEAQFGSVAAIQGAIDATGTGAAFGPIIDLIGPGTIGRGGFEPHIREHQDAKGNRVISSISYRRKADGLELGELMDPGRTGEYAAAMGTALSESLKSRGNDAVPVETVTLPSPGTTSITSPSVPSTFLPTPSGT